LAVITQAQIDDTLNEIDQLLTGATFRVTGADLPAKVDAAKDKLGIELVNLTKEVVGRRAAFANAASGSAPTPQELDDLGVRAQSALGAFKALESAVTTVFKRQTLASQPANQHPVLCHRPIARHAASR
jgi:hypothetical protein